MSILGDVLKELFKMFVADLRLTLTILGGVIAVAFLLKLELIAPLSAGFLLLLLCLGVLAETILRKARARSSD